ncbi:MAG: DEAD/DEAH box helicase [Verrucomicrobia bacterium]|nr:DEAD/DEAH box helicase [Verrucomicrobiota bacterium]
MNGDSGKILARAKAVLRDAARLEQATHSPAGEAKAAADGLVTEAALRRLDAMPLEELKPLARGEGIRWAALESNGFRSVGDLQRAGWAAVDAKPGVGEQTVRALRGVVTSIFDEVRQTISIAFDPEARTKAHTALLAGLWTFEFQQGLRTPLLRHVDLRTRLETEVRPAAGIARFWTRWFLWGDRRREAEEAMDQLAGLTGDPAFALLEEELRSALRGLKPHRPDETGLWEDFAKRPSVYYALLEQVHAQPKDDAAAARGFVPAEIVEAVENLELRRDGLHLSLRAYQVFGAKFAVVQRKTILGDEMGLGKTIQALAFIAHLKTTGASHILVVCPACVLANWEHEIARFSDFTTLRLHGPDREPAFQNWSRNGGIGLTTYDTLRTLDFASTRLPGIVIADEAHYVKNPATKRAQALSAIAGPADRVLFMTGTPMENRREEFKALVGYLQPGTAGSLGETVALPGSRAFRERVAPVYLRRNQADVLHELPERIEVEDWLDLGTGDGALYRQAVASGNFMAMRRAAILPGKPEESSKLARLLDIVEEAREEGLKVVVFSFFRDVLEVIRAALPDPVFGPLTGSVSASNRFELVKEFSACQGPAVLVSQIQAGGVGLNIQAASIVVIAEPQWKPSTEEQAIARCHRMGQLRRVQVHRLLTRHSVDERMVEILRRKAREFDEIARPSVIKDTSSSATAAHNETEVNEVVEALQRKTEAEIIRLEQERLAVS